MKTQIQIETSTFVRFWLVILGFALAALLIYSARTGLIIIGTAMFLALALNGPVTMIAKYLPGKSRTGSTAIAFTLVVLFLGGFLLLAVPPIVQQTARFASTVPDLIETASGGKSSLDTLLDDYNLRTQFDEGLASIKENAANYTSNVGRTVVSGIGSFFGFLTSLFLVLVLAFLMLVEGPALMRSVWALYRDQRRMERHRKITSRVSHVVSGFVTGQLTVSAIGGLISGIAVLLISLFSAVPANLAIPTAALYFVLSLIPFFGSIVSAVLVIVLLALNSLTAAIIYGIFFVVYQQIENNLISPAIQSKRLELSPLLILSAVTIGIYLFGIVGAIISIPIAGSIKVLFEEYIAHSKSVREKNTKPLAKLAKKVK